MPTRTKKPATKKPATKKPATKKPAAKKAATKKAATKKAATKKPNVAADVVAYHRAQTTGDRAICDVLSREICAALPDAENKIWHRHPVWFLGGNPIVGYSRLKADVRLLFWSGQSFDEPGLHPEGTFKAAEARYGSVDDVDVAALRKWLAKSRAIQWDYKNIVKRKGLLERIG